MDSGYGDWKVRYVVIWFTDIASNLYGSLNEWNRLKCTAQDCNNQFNVCGVISPGPTGHVMSYDLKPGDIIVSFPDSKAKVHSLEWQWNKFSTRRNANFRQFGSDLCHTLKPNVLTVRAWYFVLLYWRAFSFPEANLFQIFLGGD